MHCLLMRLCIATRHSMASPSNDQDQENEDEDEDIHSESEGNNDSDEDASSVSSFRDSEFADSSFAPMPARLALPLELQRAVLSFEDTWYQEMWGTYRFVCKAWKESVEFSAKTEWLREASFDYPGEVWDATDGRTRMGGYFEFQRLEGELAVFQILDCSEKDKKSLIKACKRTKNPDVQVGEIVHDVEIPGISIEWDTLTITCAWRVLIGRVMAEELRVEAHRELSQHAMMGAAKRARRTAPGGEVDMDTMMDLFKMFANNMQDAYVAVRTQRRGGADPRGDERLKKARFVASMR
ncbi:hypothetical protein DFH06DRAFT_1473223 [Mycena polygramma]|nr:hypothetical protein DFH06DRAFT_1473223 [Mycena polygramma]